MSRASFLTPDFKTNIVTNIGTPVNPTDAANKAYVDSRAPLETDAAQNTGYGLSTLIGITSGTYNTSLGWEAAKTVTTGSTGTFIGAASGPYAAGAGNFITTLGYGSLAFSEALALGGLAQARGLRSVALGKGATATLDDQIMLGAAAHRVYVNNDPVAALEVATKQYADNHPWQFALGNVYVASGDANTMTRTGMYELNPAVTNVPTPQWGLLDVRGNGVQAICQLWMSHVVIPMQWWIRNTDGVGGWTAWTRIATTTDMDTKVTKTGDTMTGALTTPFLTSTGGLRIQRPSGNSANIEFTTDSLLRWTMGKGPGAETGINAGAEFNIAAWDDAGNWLSNPVSIKRWDGWVTLAGRLTVEARTQINGDLQADWMEMNYGGWSGANISQAEAPIDPDHLTNKAYVDSKIGGSIWVQPAAPTVSVPPTGYPLWLDTDEAEVSVALGNRNRIMNGDFSVNQRGFSSGSGLGSVTGLDRWLSGAAAGTVTYSVQTAALGELPESARTFARIVVSGQSAAGDYSHFNQRIESVRTLSGKTVTVSFWAKAASGTPKISLEFTQSFGTGGSPSIDVTTYAGQVTISTTWTRYSITGAMPSITGKTLGTAGNDYLRILLWTSAGTTYNARSGSLGIQSNTFDFWGVQVEEGAVATPYEQRTYADELRACQRYFYKIQGTADANYQGYAGIGSGNALSATGGFISVALPTALRGKPAVTTAGCVVYNGAAEKAVTGITTVYWSPLSPVTCFLDLLTSGLVAAQSLVAYTGKTTAGYLEFNAEI